MYFLLWTMTIFLPTLNTWSNQALCQLFNENVLICVRILGKEKRKKSNDKRKDSGLSFFTGFSVFTKVSVNDRYFKKLNISAYLTSIQSIEYSKIISDKQLTINALWWGTVHVKSIIFIFVRKAAMRRVKDNIRNHPKS